MSQVMINNIFIHLPSTIPTNLQGPLHTNTYDLAQVLHRMPYLTHSHSHNNLAYPIQLTCMSLDCGGNPR